MIRKKLILHADDLGLSATINEASFEALENGWVTSASAMVPADHFKDVARFSRKKSNFYDIGIHLTFTSEWSQARLRPCAGAKRVKSLVDHDGRFFSTVEQFIRHARPEDVVIEAEAQIQFARDAGLMPSHIDCHMFALYQSRDLRKLMAGLALRHNLPFLFPEGRVFSMPSSATADDWPKKYIEIIQGLPDGLTELVVHLGRNSRDLKRIMGNDGPYAADWRERDLEFVGSYFLLGFLKKENVELTNWKRLWPEIPASHP